MAIPVHATKYNVALNGFAYSPTALTVHVGDTVTIGGSLSHPLLQVSKATWNANGTAALAGGFGPSTKNVTFTVTSQDTIYYICTAHVQFGMKGKIVVAGLAGIDNQVVPGLSVSLFPNPVSETGTVKFTGNPESVTVALFSIDGQLQKDLTPSVVKIGGESYVTFDASRMPAGNYFVLATDGRSKAVSKFEVIR